MAVNQIPFRANTQSAMFPLLSELSTQTVIASEVDQSYAPQVSPEATGAPLERGIPQLMYCHNVMPSPQGYQSVAYEPVYGMALNTANIDEVHLVITREGNRTYIAVDYTVEKTMWILDSDGIWRLPNNFRPWIGSSFNRVSVATVNGKSYVCIGSSRTFQIGYGSAGHYELNHIVLKGLEESETRGLVAAQGYLIAWTTTNVAWSATNDPEDFEPSDITGAGGGAVQEATGNIVFCQGTSYGFIIYTTNNAVSVTWSGNTEYPFNFKSIAAAGGVAHPGLVAVESAGAQYAYTSNGLQQVFHTGGKTVLPAITDFLAGKIFEDFDEEHEVFMQVVLSRTSTMRKKVALICDRYLVLSYGIRQDQPFTHAIVVDIVSGRLGKLRVVHNACFEWRNLDPEYVETPRDSIAFVHPNGTVTSLDFSTQNPNAQGVALFGKYQLTREAGTTLLRVQVENIPDQDNFVLKAFQSYDGKNFKRKVAGVRNEELSEGLTDTYMFNIDAKSHTLYLKGRFNVIGLILHLSASGSNV